MKFNASVLRHIETEFIEFIEVPDKAFCCSWSAGVWICYDRRTLTVNSVISIWRVPVLSWKRLSENLENKQLVDTADDWQPGNGIVLSYASMLSEPSCTPKRLCILTAVYITFCWHSAGWAPKNDLPCVLASLYWLLPCTFWCIGG